MPKIIEELTPFWTTRDGETARLYQGNVVDVLRRMEAQSVHMVVTSPPYWGLRDYGTGTWVGGNPKCDHVERTAEQQHKSSTLGPSAAQRAKGDLSKILPADNAAFKAQARQYATKCGKCGAKRVDEQLGSEKSPDCGAWARGTNCADKDWANGCHVCRMRIVFREVYRVLRDDGTLWLNYGDTYGAISHKAGDDWQGDDGMYGRKIKQFTSEGKHALQMPKSGLKAGNLVGVPWRVALGLQADGWILRQDIIWCLSGGTWVYARTQKGDMPMMLRDAARLDPQTVKLWNGEKWTQVLGWSRTSRNADELELVLRSGERISCTPNHQFPTQRGLLRADEIVLGDCLEKVTIPEPDVVKDCAHVGEDAAWLAGLYLAEGSMSKDGKGNDKCAHIAGHVDEKARWQRVKRIVESYGGSVTRTNDGNKQTIRIWGKMVLALIRSFVAGHTAHDKCLAPVCWKYSNKFLRAYLDGYLSGDGSYDSNNDRWRLGFTRNYSLERDMRVLAARLGFTLTLNPSTSTGFGETWASFRGEIRFNRSGHHNERNVCEVVDIRKARCREVYDVGVEDEPHLFALASGVLTHNSKKSPMPESVRNRCTKSHEYVFLMAKQMGYYFDAEAIKEKAAGKYNQNGFRSENVSGDWVNNNSKSNDAKKGKEGTGEEPTEGGDGMRNKRSVWSVASAGYAGAHFACYPPALIEPCVLAGSSEKGCCADCGAPWKRIVEEKQLIRERPNKFTKRDGAPGTGSSMPNDCAGVETKTVGWEPTCECHGSFEKTTKKKVHYGGWNADLDDKNVHWKKGHLYDKSKEVEVEVEEYVSDLPLEEHPVVPCTVLDPFIGSGTSICVANENGRRGVGIDLSKKYLQDNAIHRITGVLLNIPDLAAQVAAPAKKVKSGEDLL